MIAEFWPRYFDLSGPHPEEVQLSQAQMEEFLWGRRDLTRVRWDDQIDYVIEVGTEANQFALDELQMWMASEYTAPTVSEGR